MGEEEKMEFTFKTRQLIKVGEEVGGWFELQNGAYEKDLGILAKLISIFGDVDKDKAIDEIDNRLEKGDTVAKMYEEIFKGLNEKGFFTDKLEAQPMVAPVNMNKITKEIYERVTAKKIEELKI